MPELPEVEVVRRSLQSIINGLKIKKVTIFNRNLRYKIKRNFEKIIEHQKIIFIKRRSKFLLLGLENNFTILPQENFVGSEIITAYVSDNLDLDSSNFMVTVLPVNDQPWFSDITTDISLILASPPIID